MTLARVAKDRLSHGEISGALTEIGGAGRAGDERDELERVHESISNITGVIRMDLVNLLSSMDALDLGDESVQLVLAILKSRRLRPMPLSEHRKLRRTTQSNSSPFCVSALNLILVGDWAAD